VAAKQQQERFVKHYLVAGDGGVDGAGPGIDAAGDGLGLLEALIAEPDGYGERTGAVVAKDEDGGVFIELFEGAGRDFVHGDEGCAFDVGGVVLPLLTDVEEDGWLWGGEVLLELVDGDFEIHVSRIQGKTGLLEL